MRRNKTAVGERLIDEMLYKGYQAILQADSSLFNTDDANMLRSIAAGCKNIKAGNLPKVFKNRWIWFQKG